MQPSKFSLIVVLSLWLGIVSDARLPAQDWKGPGRFRGLVLDSGGKPVEGAEITLRWVEVTYVAHLDIDETEVTEIGPEPLVSDAEGRWKLLWIRPGVWQLDVEHPQHGTWTGMVRVPSLYMSQSQETRPRPVRVVLSAEDVDLEERLRKGERLLAEGRTADARSELESVLPHLEDAERSVLLVTVARTWYLEGNVPAALARLHQAVELHPGNLDARMVLFELLLAEGHSARALEVAELFVAEHPDDPRGRLLRARALLALERPGKARKDLEGILREQDSGPEATEARRLLSELEQEQGTPSALHFEP